MEMIGDSVLLTLLVLFFLLVLFILALNTSKRIPGQVKRDVFEKLSKIKKDIDTGTVSASRDGIVRLDSLMARAMKIRFQNDSTFGDNMKAHKKFFGRQLNQQIWDFHKLRNTVVHESIDVSVQEAKDAYKAYSKAISKLLQ